MAKLTWEKPEQHPGDWQYIRMELAGSWTIDQVRQAAGALGYALREIIRGEDLGEPERIRFKVHPKRGPVTVARLFYDSTKTRSDDPDTAEAFARAARYIAEGSPIRKTNRAGQGTAGTRLVEGLGEVAVRFKVA